MALSTYLFWKGSLTKLWHYAQTFSKTLLQSYGIRHSLLESQSYNVMALDTVFLKLKSYSIRCSLSERHSYKVTALGSLSETASYGIRHKIIRKALLESYKVIALGSVFLKDTLAKLWH